MTAFTVRHPRVTFVVDPSICTNVIERAASDLPGALRLVVKPPKGAIRSKASYPGMLADEDRQETFRTLHRLHAVRHAVRVVPTHDYDAARGLCEQTGGTTAGG